MWITYLRSNRPWPGRLGSMSDDATPAKVRLNDGLGRLLDEWEEASGNLFHHGETLRGVSRDDLLTLMSAVEAATREQCAQRTAAPKRLIETKLVFGRSACNVELEGERQHEWQFIETAPKD